MKRYLYLLIVVMVIMIFGCACEKHDYAMEFKNDYESVNGLSNANGKVHRSITLDEKNLFVETTAEEIVKMIEKKETFYVYFGSRLCPWCRSTIEMADQVSRDNGIDKIYYVDIWDDEGKEILRDKYSLNSDNELELSQEGTDAYKKLLKYFDNYLKEYVLKTTDGEEISTGEKRIFAPNYFYIQNGECKRMTTGTSSLQKDSREELTKEMLDEEKEMFDKFFLNYCDDAC